MNDSKKPMATSNINTKLVRELADLMAEKGLSEVEISDGGKTVRVSRGTGMAQPAAAPPQPAQEVVPQGEEKAATGSEAVPNGGTLTSPMVGTVYLAPQPGAATFVKEGDTVAEGETLLIIEAMKVMNPIPAHRAGRVRRIHVVNEQPVEFGEPLLVIE